MKTVKEIKTRYYKYDYTAFAQPTLTQETPAVGGDDFAVEVSSIWYDGGWKAFDNVASTYWHAGRGLPQWLTFYNPFPLNVTSLEITNDPTGRPGITTGIVQASNDNLTWIDLKAFTNTVTAVGDSWSIDLSDNTEFYKYYRLYITGSSYISDNSYWAVISQINITATERKIIAGSASDYDYFDTVEVRKLVIGTEKKFYKYVYRPFVQPVLTQNGTIGGGSFAVSADSEETAYDRYAWKAFDNDVTTMWASGGGANQGWIEIYNPDPLNITSVYWTFPSSYTGHNPATLGIYAGDSENNLTLIATIDTQSIYTGSSFTLDLSANTNYYKIYRFETLGQVHTNTQLVCGEMTITATEKALIETSRDDYDSYSDEGRVYYKAYDYSTAGTYTFNIERSGLYLITLIGGGGGSAQTDGGTDAYADTGWANHYGHNGGNGGIFQGYANLASGTLTITVGAVGKNLAGKGNAAGNGGDSYAIYTPLSGDPIEIARAGGGHSGYPDGSNYTVNVPGGTITYNATFFEKIVKIETGKPGKLVWMVHI